MCAVNDKDIGGAEEPLPPPAAEVVLDSPLAGWLG
jgi:hypothetical protein